MSMTTPALVGRYNPTSTRRRSILRRPELSRYQDQGPYDLVELSPRPVDDALQDDPLDNFQISPMTRPSIAWQDQTSGMGSISRPRGKPGRPIFAGPPPPITASTYLSKSPPKSLQKGTDSSLGYSPPSQRSGVLRSLLFDYRQDPHQEPTYRADTTWRGLRRQEAALETEVQQLLDLQATGLVSGLNGAGTSPGEDTFSESGSITPTGTFYSTVSRMASSLYPPMLSTAEGNVIPVRQPRTPKPRGLRSARAGLRRVMFSLAQLKLEEDSYIDDALAERRRALKVIDRLNRRKESVSKEIQTLEEAEEEPLGQELRELTEKYDSMTIEIRTLEEKLISLRNQRRWLRSKIEDVKNQREAGLSGYRGALQEIEGEVSALMDQPPVQPLDLEALKQDDKTLIVSTGGLEFLQLIPERRTLDMAKAWWDAEVAILERYRIKINSDRQALDDGAAIWDDVMRLVSDYERRLRAIIAGELPVESAKGKERELSTEDLIRDQLPEMDKVVVQLEKHFRKAEEKRWTLLICAIGAELEAFQEALAMLRDTLPSDAAVSPLPTVEEKVSQDSVEQLPESQESRSREGSSDNEVPADLLLSDSQETTNSLSAHMSPPSSAEPALSRLSSDSKVPSENEVPPEFLAVHDGKED